ncbi:hypothetical protein [Blastococcus sp. TF02-8]|uniref:hypothetical protein n=1 Tax=Blastococcus sp. TF02-8 TaxID=2250574 RepID=UPI0011BDC630|nr:hypothetical protein [Blastococcus sp. TF02-8]
MSAAGSYNVQWFTTVGAGAGWVYAMAVQGCFRDIDAAYAEEDWPTVVEACHGALSAITYCHQALAGFVGAPARLEHVLELALGTATSCAAARALPVAFGAGRADADAARAVVVAEDALLVAALPVRIPVLRSADGFFPNVRIAADIEALRGQEGLPALDWMSLVP